MKSKSPNLPCIQNSDSQKAHDLERLSMVQGPVPHTEAYGISAVSFKDGQFSRLTTHSIEQHTNVIALFVHLTFDCHYSNGQSPPLE
jgi:hypothetical protein